MASPTLPPVSPPDVVPEAQLLSWQEAPTPALLRLAGPIAISMVSYASMTLVDTLFVARLGTAELAGVGVGGLAAFALSSFIIGLLQGGKILVSQAIGSGEREQAGRYAGAAMTAAVALGVVATLAGIAVAFLLPLVTATEESGLAGRSYLSIRSLGSPIIMLFVAMREVRYGLGDSRTPMIAAVIANIANIGCDALFIFGFQWGVAGAGLATVVAQSVELAMLLALIRWGRRSASGPYRLKALRPVMSDLRMLFRVGIPTGIQFLLEVGAFATLTFMLAALDERQMAAHQIAVQVLHFAFLPIVAIGEAASVLVGQAIGAIRYELVPRIARSAVTIAVGYGVLFMLVFAFLNHEIAGAFRGDEELRAITARLLLVAAAFQIVDACNITGRCILRGAGDVRYAAIVGVLSAWVCTPPLTWLFGYHFGLGALGGWFAICAEISVAAILLWHRFLGGRWRGVADDLRHRREQGLLQAPPL